MNDIEHSLFPREPKELAAASFDTVLKVLEREKKARKYVFRNDLDKLGKKIREIDEAQTSLKILYRLATEVNRSDHD